MPESTAKRRINWGVLGVEAGAIFFSVLLGFGVAEWRDARDQDRRQADVLEAFALEVADNRDGLIERGAYHHWLVQEFGGHIETGEFATFADIFQDPRVTGFNPLQLERTAWATATATGDIALLDFDTAGALWRLYDQQADVDAEQTRLRALALNAIGGGDDLPVGAFLVALREFTTLEREMMYLSNEALTAVAHARERPTPRPVPTDTLRRDPFASAD